MTRSLGKMADRRAQDVLMGDCGPIPGQHTLTAVPLIRRRLSLNRKGVLKMVASSDGFPLMGKLPPVAGNVWMYPRVVTWYAWASQRDLVIWPHSKRMLECLWNQLRAEYSNKEAWETALPSAFHPVYHSQLYYFLHFYHHILLGKLRCITLTCWLWEWGMTYICTNICIHSQYSGKT